MKELCYIVDKKFLFHVDEEELADKFEDIISKGNFIESQKKEIFTGLKNGINAELYSYEDFATDEMEACRIILENKYNVPIERKYYGCFKEYLIANKKGIDLISLGYKDKYLSAELREIRLGIENGVDVSIYDDNSKYNFKKMRVIRAGLEDGVNINLYKNPEFSFPQMDEIFIGLSEGLDVSIYANPNITVNEMKKQRHKLEFKHNLRKLFTKVFN